MGKSKRGTALYEVLRRDNLTEQQAWARESESTGTVPGDETKGPAAPAKPVETKQASPQPARPTPTAPGLEASEAASAGAADGPIWRVAGGKLHLALSTFGVAGVIFGLGCLLLVGYVMGNRAGLDRGRAEGYLNGKQATQAAALDEIGRARTQPPTSGIFEGVGDSPVQPVGTRPAQAQARPDPMDPPAGARWVKGYTYVVVQDFRADAQADAQHASRFLADSGVETAILELSGNWKYRLVTTQGFNRDDRVQKKLAGEYLARIRKLGQNYFEAGGRYRLEGYFKKLTSQSW